MTDERNGSIGEMIIGRGMGKTRRKLAPIVTLFTTNPTYTDLGMNQVRRGEKRLLYKNVRIKRRRTIILALVL
jgi:hypothetical protein